MIKQLVRACVFGLLLGLLAASTSAHAQTETPPETEVIFRWKGTCTVSIERDLTDWNVDPDTGGKNYVLRWIRYNCPFDRDVTFDYTLTDGIKRTTVVATAAKAPHSIPLFIQRVTEDELSWNFTPDHVDVKPGSVSVPSLLTSGGDATGNQALSASAAITPTANALLISSFGANETAGSGIPSFTYTTTFVGAGAFTAVAATLANANKDARQEQSYSQMGATPGTGVVTNTYGVSTPNRSAWIIVEVTGHNTSTPTTGSNTATGAAASTMSITLAAPSAGGLMISSIGANATAAVTDGADDTEVTEATSTGTAQERVQMQYGTAADPDWAGLNTSAGNQRGVAINYQQAAAGATAQAIFWD